MHVDVLQFTNFRSFLQAYAQAKKDVSPKWTYGRWAQQLGLKGTASLTMVLNGQRNPGPAMIQALEKYFQFNRKEAMYFKSLVALEKSAVGTDTHVEILQKLNQLSTLKNYRFLDEQTFRVISEPHHLTIRQMTKLGKIPNDSTVIAKALKAPVSEKKIRQAIENLLSLGLVKNVKGYLTGTDESLRTSEDIPSEAIKRHHEATLESAKLAVRSIPPEFRELQAITFAMDDSRLIEAKKLIRKFIDDFESLMESSQGTNVYQLSAQLIPQTDLEKVKGTKE